MAYWRISTYDESAVSRNSHFFAFLRLIGGIYENNERRRTRNAVQLCRVSSGVHRWSDGIANPLVTAADPEIIITNFRLSSLTGIT